MTLLTKWTPTTDLMTLRRLGKTCEELGELVAVLGRTICQGLDGVDPATGEGNIERITKESADVLAQIGCNVEAFRLDQARISARVADKSRQMGEWEAMFKGDRQLTVVPYDDTFALLRSTGFMTRDQCHETLELLQAKGITLSAPSTTQPTAPAAAAA